MRHMGTCQAIKHSSKQLGRVYNLVGLAVELIALARMHPTHGGWQGPLGDGEGLVVREDAQFLVSGQTAGLAVRSAALAAPPSRGCRLAFSAAFFLPNYNPEIIL